jgi:hypothetical protein
MNLCMSQLKVLSNPVNVGLVLIHYTNILDFDAPTSDNRLYAELGLSEFNVLSWLAEFHKTLT